MREKRGQLFMIWLVFITFVMAGLGIYTYFLQNSEIGNSMVGIGEIELRDVNQRLFDIQERNMILVSAGEISRDYEWGSVEFNNAFRERFFDYFINSGDFSESFFSDIVVNGEGIGELDDSEKRSFLNVNYVSFFENGKLKVSREEIEKSFILRTSELDKINFAVGVNYKYDKEYVIDQEEL